MHAKNDPQSTHFTSQVKIITEKFDQMKEEMPTQKSKWNELILEWTHLIQQCDLSEDESLRYLSLSKLYFNRANTYSTLDAFGNALHIQLDCARALYGNFKDLAACCTLNKSHTSTEIHEWMLKTSTMMKSAVDTLQNDVSKRTNADLASAFASACFDHLLELNDFITGDTFLSSLTEQLCEEKSNLITKVLRSYSDFTVLRSTQVGAGKKKDRKEDQQQYLETISRQTEAHCILRHAADKGYSLNAQKEVHPGVILIMEPAFAFVISDEFSQSICTWCLSDFHHSSSIIYPPIPLLPTQSRSSNHLFCCEECRDQYWEEFGSNELKAGVSQLFHSDELTNETQLAIRTLVKLQSSCTPHDLAITLPDNMKSLSDFERMKLLPPQSTENISTDIMETLNSDVETVFRLLEASNNTSPPFTRQSLLEQLVRTKANSLSIHGKKKKTKIESIALGIYPTVSLMNHSCDPNCHIEFHGSIIGIPFSSAPAKPGTELTISYGPKRFETPAESRVAFLKSHYLLDCKCFACTNTRDYDKKRAIVLPTVQTLYERGHSLYQKKSAKNISTIVVSLSQALKQAKENEFNLYRKNMDRDAFDLYGAICQKLALIHTESEQYDTALQHHLQFVKASQTLNGYNSEAAAWSYNYLVMLLLALKHYRPALYYVRLGLGIMNKIRDKTEEVKECISDFEASLETIQFDAQDLSEKSISFCTWCLKDELHTKLSQCARCKQVQYCSKECQANDWKIGGHRSECAQLSSK